ncbi:MAG: TolC family protein [Deltaproteobacteria bacterium]|nr:TolC family protein [Deltaproteobacteria bacterium]
MRAALLSHRLERKRRTSKLAAAVALSGLLATSGARADDAPAPSPPAAPVAESRAKADGDAKPVTLDEVLTSVRLSFPLIVAALRDQAAAAGDLLSAEGAFDPTVKARGGVASGYYDYGRVEISVEQPTPFWGTSLIAGWRLGQGFSPSGGGGQFGGIPSYYGELATFDAGEIRAGVSVPLWRNGPIDRRRASIRRAEIGQRIASLSTEQQKIEAARAAAHRYWDWVAAGARVAIARDWYEIAKTRDAALGERAARGDIPAFEQLENRRTLVQREGAVVAATRSLEQAAIELSMYLRDARGEPALAASSRLPPAFPDAAEPFGMNVEASIERAHDARPEPARLSAQREQFDVDRRFAENQLAPGIDLSLVGVKDLGSATDGMIEKQGTPMLEVGLTIDIPIPNRAARGRVEAARAGAEKVEAQAKLVRDRIAADVRDAASALRAAKLRVEVAHREVALAEELEAGERRRFELGDSTLLIVNLREQATAEARIREVDAKSDVQRAMASYRAALGELGR